MSRRAIAWTVAVIVALGAVGVGGWFAYDWLMTKLVRERCYLQVDGQTEPLALTAEQSKNAAIIVAASYVAKLPERAAVVALATAWQESGLRNLDYGDRDSLGLFQQRPSYGWGTEEQIMDPWYSSGRFYEEIVKFDNWETTDVNDMAQKVQRSGHPEAYRKHEANAVALAGALRGTRPATLACIDRSGTPGDASAFAKVVESVSGVTSTVDGTTVTLKANNATALWSATQLAVANSRTAGVVSVTVADRHLESEKTDKQWSTAKTPAAAETAVFELRAP